MVRSVGIAAVMAGFVWTGFAGAQTSAPPASAAVRLRYITVREEGKPPQRCMLLKNWRDANGVPVFQVRAVESGEIMTIVGSGPSAGGGEPRAMSTRIFHWGRDNKPPAGAPLPPPTAGVMAAPQPQPIRPAPLAPAPQPAPPLRTAQKPAVAPVPAPSRPIALPPMIANNKPTPSAFAAKPNPTGTGVSPVVPNTQVVKQLPASGQPRLVPMAAGNAACPTPCNGTCPPSCRPCCTSCKPCCNCQPSCVCGTPSPMRQPFLSRLFQSNPPRPSTAVASRPLPSAKPAAAPLPLPAMAKVTTEPAKPGDWRESWGKVERGNTSTQASSYAPTQKVTTKNNVQAKRADPTPVQMETPKQPDPLKAPDHYRDLAMSQKLVNSKIPAVPSQNMGTKVDAAAPPIVASPVPIVKERPRFLASRERKNQTPLPDGREAEKTMAANAASSGRAIQLPSDEPNAFWSPPQPPAKQERPKYNAFDRGDDSPPPQGIPQLPPSMVRGPMPPQGPMLKNPPHPPAAPWTRPSPPQPMAPDTGVPDAMANAFTLAGTSRPIPADFGGTPQEPNGFDPMVRNGQGSPPRAYGMAPPMPNRVAMAPPAPTGVHPLMNVPPSAGSATASAPPAGVPRLLATLKNSLYPSERESAAEQLSELDWHIQPLVVENLMKSAREDPAATVRAACVHALAQMKVNTAGVMALVRDLQSDRDPRVRQEAEEALSVLGESGIQQASHR